MDANQVDGAKAQAAIAALADPSVKQGPAFIAAADLIFSMPNVEASQTLWKRLKPVLETIAS